MTPQDITRTCVLDSVEKEWEVECVAKNIIVILARTGNTFRKLSWDEYKAERKKDGNFTVREVGFFNKAVGYCESENLARSFCPGWGGYGL
jgi:hypothetical protein